MWKKALHDTPFQIYNASAGSGKTYTLAKEYLKIILSSPRSYKQVLAITFTNKAVNEMKHRILDSLFDFSKISIIDRAPEMFKSLSEELEIDTATLQYRAKIALKQILHNYAFFDISTIDKFTHRLIRTFAKDLKLPQNFEVVLDSDLLLGEAVARLIDKAGTDEKLTGVLINFALEKIDEDKSWDVAFDLNKIGKVLFDENQVAHIEKLESKGIDDFLELKENIKHQIVATEKKMVSKASKALLLIEENGLEFGDFYKNQFPDFMLLVKELKPTINFNAQWKNQFEDSPLYVQKCPDSIKAKIDALKPQFGPLLDGIKDNFFHLLFFKNVYVNIVPLTVLNSIHHEVRGLLKERDQISISEFNTIISKEIKHQPAPFIYERLGEKYRHYFIDEFQDTSIMQWNNLIPLIGNVLESEDEQGKKGSLFLVGDVKQAIYRWRGGKAEQFLNLINKETNPFVVAPSIKALPKNYRSHREIIEFNNAFFTTISPQLNHALYGTLFKEGNKQEVNAKEGGLVQITLLNKDDGEQNYCEEVLRTIETVLDKKYRLTDIAILVRDNKHGIVLADFLTDQGIPIISPDSLLIDSNEDIKFLIHLLHLSTRPEDSETCYQILYFLAKDLDDKHRFIHDSLLSLDKLLKESYDFDLDVLKRSSVYDGLEYAIKKFRLAESSNAYITYFMDAVFEIEQKEGTGIPTFLSHWEKKKGKLSITAPENVDAVHIMSIHKAKGLEFPIVIFPYANTHIYKEINPKLWVDVQKQSFNGFEEVLIGKKQEVINYSAKTAALYDEEQHKLELDAFNVLYVALTRAVTALYIISEKDLNKSGTHNTNYYSGLFIQYLKEKGLWDQNRNLYSFGRLENSGHEEVIGIQKNIDYQYSFKERPSFRVLARSGVLWDTEREEAITKGNLIHYIMGLIETEKDLPRALATLQQNGDIAGQELNYVMEKVNQIINHPELRNYYIEGNVIFNERDIITNKGRLLRPDRVVIQNNRATLIDYKSGKKNPIYHEQLYTYEDALKAMGYQVDNKIIVYIHETITPEFI